MSWLLAQAEPASSVVWYAMVGGGIAVGLLLFVALMKRLLYLCPPNEVLVFSGRRFRTSDGSSRGYRVVVGGRAWRVPFIETVQRMNLSIMEVPISIRGAYSKGGVPLNVDAIANVKISSDPGTIGNAIERFLNQDPNQIRRVAKETLEGHLRGVLATLTPEEVNEDRLKFADQLLSESEPDLRKLGIHLDTLKIQHVSDDTHYLDSVGRAAIAMVVRDAEMAESDFRRQAEQVIADNQARGSIRMANAEAKISQLKNELRKIQADLNADVNAEEERTLAAARQARAVAEQELQQIRSELETVRLQVETVLPAEANRQAQEFRARGNAALLREQGATAGAAVEMIQAAWKDAGDLGPTLYVLQDLDRILEAVSAAIKKLQIQHLQIIDNGDGQVLQAYLASYPAMMGAMLTSVKDLTGVDVAQTIRTASTSRPGPNQEAKS